MSLILESDLAAAMASVTSRSRVSGPGHPDASPKARAPDRPRSVRPFALRRDDERRAARHGRDGRMQRRENEAKSAATAQVQYLADPPGFPDQPEESPRADRRSFNRSDLLVDARGFTGEVPQVVQLGAAHAAGRFTLTR